MIECTCPSEESGYGHAAWCAREIASHCRHRTGPECMNVTHRKCPKCGQCLSAGTPPDNHISHNTEARPMKAVSIVQLLRSQFYKPGHRLECGRPLDGPGAVYEVYPDGDRTLFARFDSSADAEAVVAAINEACAGMLVKTR